MIEVFGDGDDKADVEVAALIGVQMFDTLAAKTNDGAGLGAGADFELDGLVESGNFDSVT